MNIRYRSGIVFAFLFFAAFTGVAFGAYPKPVGFVNDFAGILPAPARQNLEQILREYKQKTSVEIVVVTVSSLDGEAVEDCTIGLARAWGVGKKKNDNGVVLLVAPNERKARIETGYNIEPHLTDGEAGRIIREKLIPAFKKNDYPAGVLAGAYAIIEKLSNASSEDGGQSSDTDSSGGHWPRWVVILLIIVFVILLILAAVSDESGGSGGKRSGGSDGIFFGGGWTSGGSGGSSGGSGFGGFGGGSFGGGGASGSW